VKVSTKQLPAQLAKGVSALYAVHGPETLLALDAADRIRAAARAQGATEREIFFAEPGCDWGRLSASASNLSLFASRRLIEIRIPTGKPGTEGARAIDAWCERLPRGREAPADLNDVTLVLLPELEWQSFKASWFGALDRVGVVVEARSVTRDELPDWLAQLFAKQKQRASVETLEWLADRVEGNLLAARQEVEKLALLLPQGEIELDAIRGAVTDVSRFDRDALLDAIHAEEPARIARVLASLRAEGEPLPLLLWALTEELRALMSIAANERPRRFLTPERARAMAKTAARHGTRSFDSELLRAHRIDRMIKGVDPGDPWDSLLELALGIAGRPVIPA
jgi:DNA polymerase-3 subunit delta